MIYKFRIVSSEADNFFCDIAIRSEQTFYDLHICIQDTVNYDSSQLASFFLTNNIWEKQRQVTLIDMGNVETETLVMDQTLIGEHLTEIKQKLLYVFDFFNERTFFIELEEIKDDNDDHYYPICLASGGEAPPQIKLSDISMDGIFNEEDDDDDDGPDIDDEDFPDIKLENIDDFDNL